MSGIGFYDAGRSPRTRDWSRPPESEKSRPKTATEIAADAFLAQKERWKREAEADERKKAEEWQQRQEAERKKQEAERLKAEAEKKTKQELQQRRAAFYFAEQMTDQMFDEAGLTPHERSVVNNRLIDADAIHDLERTKFEVMRIVAERN
jgi:hypothetical protein